MNSVSVTSTPINTTLYDVPADGPSAAQGQASSPAGADCDGGPFSAAQPQSPAAGGAAEGGGDLRNSPALQCAHYDLHPIARRELQERGGEVRVSQDGQTAGVRLPPRDQEIVLAHRDCQTGHASRGARDQGLVLAHRDGVGQANGETARARREPRDFEAATARRDGPRQDDQLGRATRDRGNFEPAVARRPY